MVQPRANDDLSYVPEFARAATFLDEVSPTRVLIVGKDDFDLDGRRVDARTVVPPGPVLSTGCYAFRAQVGWDVMVCTDGMRPREPVAVAEEETDAEHFLLQARNWFDHFWPMATPVGPKPLFAVGDHVQLAGSTRVGRVEGVKLVGAEWVYRVIVDRLPQNISESGLQPVSIDPHDPVSWIENGPASARDFGVSITHTKLSNPLSDTIYSYLSSKTVFRPYQFRPVLRFLNSSHQRLLIADEVGLGKTIEAGLIWTELEQRNQVRRALIVCPAVLVPKWQAEMQRRFDRDLRPLDAVALGELVALFRSGEQEKEVFGVISLERLRSSKLLADLAETEPRFDLVIVDEAHYMRNRNTLSHELGQLLSDWADALIFLSATPLNLGHDDLFNLVNLLVEEEFSDKEVFPLQVEPNKYLNGVAARLLSARDKPRQLLPELDLVRSCQLGGPVTQRPEFRLLRELLNQNSLSWRDVADAKRYLAELNTLASVVTRTRKVDTPDRKAIREPVQIDVDWSEEERTYYDAVEAWARQRAKRKGVPTGFITQTPLRMAASCIPASKDWVRSKTSASPGPDSELDDFDDVSLSDDLVDDDDVAAFVNLSAATRAVGDRDTKFEAFLDALREAQRNGLRQVMVFAFYKRTLNYLRTRLASEFSVRVMHGDVKMAERLEIMDAFRSGDFDILLVSKVGGEGLDFEFCNVLFNYDLPWNPMEVEQRIGRLDRFGQAHEKIFIYNFHVPGTIETDIFERLYIRLNVFRESIGELEPILRDETADLQRIALDPDLTPEQRQQQIDRMEVALEARRQQLDDLRDARSYFAGADQLLIDGFEEDTRGRGRFLGPRELESYLRAFFADGTSGKIRADKTSSYVEIIGDETVAERVARRGGSVGASRYPLHDLLRMLRDEEPINATFSNEQASQSSLDLISLRHPLVKAAVRHFSESPFEMARFGAVEVKDAPLTGEFFVAVFLAETTGLRPSLELWPVAVARRGGALDDDAGFALLAAVAEGRLADGKPFEPAEMRKLLGIADSHVSHFQLRTEAERRESNEALVDARKAAQRASFEHKIQKCQETLAKLQANRRDQSIQRLQRGRINTLRQRLADVMEDLDARRSLALTVRPIAVAAATFV